MLSSFSASTFSSSDCLSNEEMYHQLHTVIHTADTASTTTKGLPKRKLQRALHYVHQHLAEEISLEAIATHLNMSQFYFCRLFKQSMGITPYQYLLQQRVERAKQLLLQDESSIADVALAAGFANQSHLCVQFKRIVGVTPKQFARQ